MLNRAIFVDRDGVIVREPPYYPHRLEQLRILPGVAAAVRRFKAAGFKVIIVSNQSGVARGFYTEDDVRTFNAALCEWLAQDDALIDAVYYCPHHPKGAVAEYRIECQCRKPAPGMLQQAAREHEIDLQASYMVGDKSTDVAAGHAAGCRTVLVTENQDKADMPVEHDACDYFAQSLTEAADIILARA